MYYSVSWIDITGNTYSHGSVVVIKTDLLPVFGLIEDIIIDDSHCHYLVIEQLNTICFVPHFHSYEVMALSPKVYYICEPSNLFDHTVLGLYQVAPHHSFFIPPC